ncbi:hypothetical protein RJ641_014902 [Dillenia turbinata]|uniref:AB hydrolase-1 domain-containing protein n=1 Tax=Dillenia turbinata TaxID=194707 RepID=A0AAN8YZS9_9MAGN
MAGVLLRSDLRSVFHSTASFSFSPTRILPEDRSDSSRTFTRRSTAALRLQAFYRFNDTDAVIVQTDRENSGKNVNVNGKTKICTADELHYVPVPNSAWKLALWRYLPNPKAPERNHPLLLLSGVGTNAIGYDLSPGSSFARHMSDQGFDTWILEVRGAGLSTDEIESTETKQPANTMSGDWEQTNSSARHGTNGAVPVRPEITSNEAAVTESEISYGVQRTEIMPKIEESQLVNMLAETFIRLAEGLSGFLSESQSRIMSAKLFDQISKLIEDSQLFERYNEIRETLSGLLEARQNSVIASQIKDLSQRLVNIVEEGHQVPSQFFDFQERFSTTIGDFQKQLDLIVKYDWDFDHYLEEDLPAVMEYIRTISNPKDGKLLGIGHSMGGILLYAMLSRHGFKGTNSGLVSVADPAQALNVPVVPLGLLLAAAYPLASRPPYVLSWLNPQISAQDMMHPELFEKLLLNNFCTVPAKVILQLTTAFREGGLCNRRGTFFYKDHLSKSTVPVLALAGDQDLICPPEAVYETVKVIPKDLVTYKVFGDPGGPHYAHYDLVGCRLAAEHIYPCIIDFLGHHDKIQ